VSQTTNGAKAKIGTISGRLASITKAADLLAVAREIEALGTELARAEARGDEFVWPRDMNEGGTAKEWGKDSVEDTPRG
jgi:hypothetical protein